MIGRMRHQIMLEEPNSLQGAGGHITKSWTLLATTAAAIDPLRGAEDIAAMQLEHPVTHRITVRHRPALLRARRALFGSRVFHIRSAINRGERNRFIVFMAEEAS